MKCCYYMVSPLDTSFWFSNINDIPGRNQGVQLGDSFDIKHGKNEIR
jgi:hypothetical protein